MYFFFLINNNDLKNKKGNMCMYIHLAKRLKFLGFFHQFLLLAEKSFFFLLCNDCTYIYQVICVKNYIKIKFIILIAIFFIRKYI